MHKSVSGTNDMPCYSRIHPGMVLSTLVDVIGEFGGFSWSVWMVSYNMLYVGLQVKEYCIG